MNTHLQFGYTLGRQLQVKRAAGFGAAGRGFGDMLGAAGKSLGFGAKPAVQAGGAAASAARGVSDAEKLQQLGASIRGSTGAALPRPQLPVPAGMSRAGLERQTGIILDAAGRPVPMKAPPPPSAPPARGSGALAPQPAKATVAPRAPAPPAAPARPGTVGPKPPRPKPVGFEDVSAADWAEASKGFDAYDAASAAAARAPAPPRNSPRDNQAGRAGTLLNTAGLRPPLGGN